MTRHRISLIGIVLAAVLAAPPARGMEPDVKESVNIRRMNDVHFVGAEGGDELGVQARFGDLNGDGYDEIILGAWLADGVRNERPRSGEVYVFFGKALEPPEGEAFTPSVIYGGRPGDRIGSCIDTGDYNGDGVEDLLIGARYANGPADSLRHRCGEVFLLIGNSTGETRKYVDLREGADVVIYGFEPGDRLGRRIVVEDLDQDGRDDLLLAAVGSNGEHGEVPDAGAIYVVYGSGRKHLEGEYDLSDDEFPVLYGSDESDGLGSAMATGDWNGDGVPDLIFGCGFADGPANGRTNSGEAYVLFGRRKGRFEGMRALIEGSELTIYGASAYDAAGVSIAAGDIDGDGIDDLAIGANLADGPANGRDKCGEVYILFGNRSIHSGQNFDLTYSANITIYGPEPGDQFGSVLNLFDWNGDSYADLVASSLLSDGPGEQREDAGMIYVLLGGPQGSLRPTIDLGSDEGDLFLLGPSPFDKVATALVPGRIGGRDVLFAATMLGDGPKDERLDTGEIYLLQWKPLAGE